MLKARRGWTLHEMLISLVLTGAILSLAAHNAVGQLRFFAGIGEVIALRSRVGHASVIVANTLWAASPSDIVQAHDTALQLHATIGSAISCGAPPGQLVIPAGRMPTGNTLSAFVETPEAGDDVHVLFSDSAGITWLAFHLASSAMTLGSCGAFAGVTDAWTFELVEPLSVPAGAVVRFTRPLRLSLYRASDGKSYLGARDWNGTARVFNTIQPVAGPLASYSADPLRTGLLLRYSDEHGGLLADATEAHRIRVIGVAARGESRRSVRVIGLASRPDGRYADSASVTIALRNAR